MTGLHSPFGLMYMIQKETGWTDDYILWGTSWANLQMKLADAPRYRSGKRSRTINDEKELFNFLNKYG
jgi:hypothetical protein